MECTWLFHLDVCLVSKGAGHSSIYLDLCSRLQPDWLWVIMNGYSSVSMVLHDRISRVWLYILMNNYNYSQVVTSYNLPKRY